MLPLPDFWIAQLNYIGMYSMTVLGLVLLTGVGGLTSFGQAAFVGIGAYTTAWLTLNTGISPWLTLFIGMGLTAGSALLVGLITLRMSGHYLPLATIAWGLSLYYLMGNLDALGKYDGLLGIKSLSIGDFDIGQGRAFFVLTWVILLACAWPHAAPAGLAARAAPSARSRAARRWPRPWASTPSATRSPSSCWPPCSPRSRAGCSRTSSARSTRRPSA